MTQAFHSPVIGIAGWKNSGKTTLVVRLVAELTKRGWRVATIKHAHHAIAIDDGETDSAQHRGAGASVTAVIGPNRWAVVSDVHDGAEPTLDEVVPRLTPADIILVEGYKSAPIARIEVRRAAQSDTRPLPDDDAHIIAIAADHAVSDASNPRALPVFALDDVAAIADLIERTASAVRSEKS